ncbi:zinc-ribbon domain-containing protein [bacterium]|nr:MAG: zinc-ribbon domain-containing protein [bacterium]
MLIFGFGRTRFKDFGADRPVTCERCGNEVQYRFMERKTWFTLFFIPLIPYASAKLVLCPICNNAIQMDPAVWAQRRTDAGLA